MTAGVGAIKYVGPSDGARRGPNDGACAGPTDGEPASQTGKEMSVAHVVDGVSRSHLSAAHSNTASEGMLPMPYPASALGRELAQSALLWHSPREYMQAVLLPAKQSVAAPGDCALIDSIPENRNTSAAAVAEVDHMMESVKELEGGMTDACWEARG